MPENTRTEIPFNDGGIVEIYHVDTGKKEADCNGGGMSEDWGYIGKARSMYMWDPSNMDATGRQVHVVISHFR